MTEPLSPDELASLIARAVVTDLDTGEATELTTKPDSASLFFERFEAGAYVVQLRLDWTDIDANGHPMLDAEFLDPVTLNHDSSMKKHPAHHTSSEGSGERSYEWTFAETERRFKVAVTWSATGFAGSSSSTFAEARVVRAQPAAKGNEARQLEE